ncbi:MAG: ankyrin repeat domain-containing protein [Planctomycetota bacterium]|jgi:ankyrin repeat protein
MVDGKRLVITLAILFAALVLAGCGSPVGQFHEAVKLGDLETAESLLTEQPTLVNHEQKGSTPLFKSLEAEQTDMTLLLIERGAEVNVRDNRGFTPLHCAATEGHKAVAELLIAKGAELDASDRMGRTALHMAVEAGHNEVVELLLAAGADVNAENQMGRAALHVAAKAHRHQAAELLLEQGADVSAQDKGPGRTPLHYAAKKGCKDIAQLLIAKGADVNARDNLARTPLYWASKHSDTQEECLEVAQLLRERGGHRDLPRSAEEALSQEK